VLRRLWAFASPVLSAIARRYRDELVARRALQGDTLRSVVLAGLSAFRSLTRRPQPYTGAPLEDPDVQQQTLVLLRFRRHRLARRTLLAMWGAVAVFCAFLALQILVFGDVYHAAMAYVHVAVFASLTVVNLFRSKLVSHASLPFLHGLLMAVLCFVRTIDFPGDLGYVIHAFVHVASVVFAVVCFRLEVFLSSNCILVFFIIASVIRDGEKISGTRMAGELIFSISKVMILSILEVSMRVGCRRAVEEQVGKSSQNAVMSLLELSCDVVLDIDQDGSMKQDFPKLSTMLMHGNTRPLREEPFASFVAERDRAKFEMALRRKAAEGASAPEPSIFNVRLRDSMGNLIEVAVHHVPYITIAGHMHHLIGLREEPDGAGQALCEPMNFQRKKPGRGLSREAAPDRTRRPSGSGTDTRRASTPRYSGSFWSSGSSNSDSSAASCSSDGTIGGGSPAPSPAHPFGVDSDEARSSAPVARGHQPGVSPEEPPATSMRFRVALEEGLLVKHAPQELLDELGFTAGLPMRLWVFYQSHSSAQAPEAACEVSVALCRGVGKPPPSDRRTFAGVVPVGEP